MSTTPDTLQAAADEAFSGPNVETGQPLYTLALSKSHDDWNNQKRSRLLLARALLARLPEPSNTELEAFRSFFGRASVALHQLDGLGDNGDTENFIERLQKLLEWKPTDTEKTAVESLMQSQGLTALQVMRQALRHYQMAVQGKPTPPTADGKTPGQVAFEVWANEPQKWGYSDFQNDWHRCASAVLAAFGGQASLEAGIKRMEDIGTGTLAGCFDSSHLFSLAALKKVKARLIAAAREGQTAVSETAPNWEVRFRVAQRRAEQLLSEVAKADSRSEKAEARITELEAQNERQASDMQDVAHRLGVFADDAGTSSVKNAASFKSSEIHRLNAALQKAEAELARIITAAHEAGWNGVENSKNLAQFIKDTANEAKELESELSASTAAFSSYRGLILSALNEAGVPTHHPDIGAPALKPMMPQERIKVLASPPQLRPISEAGPVPEGCVRVYSYEKSKDRWVHWKELEHTTTHFADIRLPSQAPVVEPPQPWQPSVGDVVRLRSGGPEMTVLDPEENGEFWCAWFAEETLLSQDFPATCLQPVKEEQP